MMIAHILFALYLLIGTCIALFAAQPILKTRKTNGKPVKLAPLLASMVAFALFWPGLIIVILIDP